MKYSLNLLRIVAVALFSFTPFLQAQIPGTTARPLNPAILKFFGKNTNFTAKAELRILDSSQKETMSMTLGLALLDGKMRAEMDLARTKSAMISAQTFGQIKQMGADKTIYIVHPASRTSYVIYPALNAYAQLRLSYTAKDIPNGEKISLGQETIEGHTCVKNKILETGEPGRIREAIVWNATDLKDFPMQMQMNEKDSVVLVKFKDVKFGKPDPKQFEPPPHYTKYQSMPELQRVMVEKLMGRMRK